MTYLFILLDKPIKKLKWRLFSKMANICTIWVLFFHICGHSWWIWVILVSIYMVVYVLKLLQPALKSYLAEKCWNKGFDTANSTCGVAMNYVWQFICLFMFKAVSSCIEILLNHKMLKHMFCQLHQLPQGALQSIIFDITDPICCDQLSQVLFGNPLTKTGVESMQLSLPGFTMAVSEGISVLSRRSILMFLIQFVVVKYISEVSAKYSAIWLMDWIDTNYLQ